ERGDKKFRLFVGLPPVLLLVDCTPTVVPIGVIANTVGPGVVGRLETGVLFMLMWARMRCPAASADINESSPAITAPATRRARAWAFMPGVVGWGPCIPRNWRAD